MDLKEAIIDHLSGVKVQYRNCDRWHDMDGSEAILYLQNPHITKFRRKPKPHPLEGLPVDTLVEVRETQDEKWHPRYWAGWNGKLNFAWQDGGDSKTTKTKFPWDYVRIADNDWRPWFGGECPVPGWVKVEWRGIADNQSGFTPIEKRWASELPWKHIHGAYRIVAQEVPE